MRYMYRGNTIVVTDSGCAVYNSNGFVGEFATTTEAEEYIDSAMKGW